MLKTVVLETAHPMALNIASASPDEIIILTSISGLEPADVTLFTGDLSRDGGYYQGRRVGQRNPVFNFKINPNYKENIDASDARDVLYRQFLEPTATSDGVQVRLIDDRRPDRYLIGYTEKFPADIFAQKPTAQVSMLCVDPFLKSVQTTVGENPAGWLTVPLEYDGSADTGIELTVKINAVIDTTVAPMILKNNDQIMKFTSPTGTFQPGDVIYVNTVIGSRSIKLNGEERVMMLSPDSTWIYLTQASNQLQTYGVAPGDARSTVTSYKYTASWWGV